MLSLVTNDVFGHFRSDKLLFIFEGFFAADVKPPLLSAKARSSTAMDSSKQHQILGESPAVRPSPEIDRINLEFFTAKTRPFVHPEKGTCRNQI